MSAHRFYRRQLRQFATILGIMAIATGAWAEPTLIRISEGNAVDMPSHVDWHRAPGQGWYIKEHHHAEDFAFMVCDEQSANSVAYFDLGQEVPAGRWRVFVRHIRNLVGGGNAITLSLGKDSSTGFVPAGPSVSMRWEQKDTPRDYRWAEATLTTTASANRLQIVATQIERSGIGDLPEFPLKVVLLDSVVVTNREDVRIVPGNNKRNRLDIPGGTQTVARSEQETAFRNHVWLAPDIDDFERVHMQPKTKAQESSAPVLSENRLAGGDFDAALAPYWFLVQTESGYSLGPDNLDRDEASGGHASLKFQGYNSFYNRSPRMAATLVSAPFALAPGQYTCAVDLRSDDPAVQLSLSVHRYTANTPRFRPGATIGQSTAPSLTPDWARHRFQFNANESGTYQLVVRANGFAGAPGAKGKSKGSVWLDQAYLGPDPKGQFVSTSAVSVGVHSVHNRLFHVGKTEFLVRATATDQRAAATVTYDVMDLAWQVLERGRWEIPLGDSQSGEKVMQLPLLGRRGAYLLRVHAQGSNAPPQVLDFAIVDDPNQSTAPPNFGLYCGFQPESMAYHRRAGAALTITNGDIIARGYKSIKTPTAIPDDPAGVAAAVKNAEFTWFDDIVKCYQEAGYEVIPQLMAKQMPKWAKDNPAAFGEYVRRMVQHYGKLGIERWCTGDEERSKYLPYHMAAVQAIRDVAPDDKVMVSTWPGVIEKWEADGHRTGTNYIGGSYWATTKWQYQAKAAAAKAMGRSFWNVGVGWGSRPAYAYDPHHVRLNMARGRFGVVTNVLYCHAIAAPEMLLTYINRFTNGRHFGTGDMYTGTFVPHGTYFAASAGFIRGAKPGGDIVLNHADDLDAAYFERQGRTMVMISQSQAFWGTVRGEGAFRVQIELPASQLGFYDIDLSEVAPPENTELSSFDYQIPVLGALLLEDRGVGKERLLDAVANLKATKTHGARYVLLGRQDGQIDLGIWYRNGLNRPLSGEFAVAKGVALAADSKRQRTLNIGPGESAFLRFPLPTALGRHRPIGNMITSFTFSDNRSFAMGDKAHLWAACAPRAHQTLRCTGPSGWQPKELVGYIFATSRVGGGYGTEQVRQGGRWFVAAEAREIGTQLYARWHPDAVQFGLRLNGQARQAVKEIDFMVDPALSAVLQGQSPQQQPRLIRITRGQGSPTAQCYNLTAGHQLRPYDGQVEILQSQAESADFVELLVPTALILGEQAAAARTVGFNVRLAGTVPDSEDVLEMVYSGKPNFHPMSPEGWAQLILLD